MANFICYNILSFLNNQNNQNRKMSLKLFNTDRTLTSPSTYIIEKAVCF